MMGLSSQFVASTNDYQTTRPLAVLLHGYTQNSLCWGNFADALRQHFDILLVDLPGHGKTSAAYDEASLDETAQLVNETVAPYVKKQSCLLVGYSMGGRVALHTLLDDASYWRAAVVIGTHPGIRDVSQRQQRQKQDTATAEKLVSQGLDAFLDDWFALDLFANLDVKMQAKSARMTNRIDGLVACLRYRGTGVQEPLWQRLKEVEVPLFALAGGCDAKYVALAQELADIMPNGQQITIAAAGHSAHLEQPDQCVAVIQTFYSAVGSIFSNE